MGRLLRAGQQAKADALAARLATAFPNRLYVEIQRHGVDGRKRTDAEEACEPGLVSIAYERGLPLVATNEVYFQKPEMFEAHDALICIAEGAYVSAENRRQLTSAHYFKSPAEMIERFADLPEAIANTVEIARRCAFRPRTSPPILPRFAKDEVQELRRPAHEGLEARLAKIEPVAPREEYEQRLDFELGVIEKMGFPGYFLIVADFIKWAKDHDIPVGPGRGSGAGSLVAYCLTIRLQEAEKEEEVVRTLLDIAEQVEGLYRNASTHAAGVVIGDRPLDELVPLYRDPRSDMPVTQFNMKWVEPAGLVKFDFLGLKTLTVIQNCLDLLKGRGVEIDIETIPLDDEKTYALYGRADTVGVFQVESSGMRDALRQLKPTCIEDIVALVALYRPGPMENIPKYCNVKNGREERDGLHPLIDPILDETQGIIVYQEQVMEIARKMAGYSLGGADLLRRAMGKKIKEAMDEERPKFLDGAAKNGVPAGKAREVWDLLEKFANYGFNKSHAAAYGLVSYQTGWLKANYPVEFMAAVMNLDLHLTDKLAVYKQELDRLGIEIVPPCVNRSEATFAVAEGRILYALGALKNVGVEAMKLITEERAANGPYADLFDFARRVDLKRVGKRSLEMLARAGAFDVLDGDRRRVFENLDALTGFSAAAMEEKQSAQVSLFGEATTELPAPRLSQPEDWAPTERLTEEHLAVGFYLTGHPLDEYMGPLRRKSIATFASLAKSALGAARIAGAVLGRQERKSARGARYAFVQLSDPTGLYEVTVFSDTLAQHRELLEPGNN
ncbi:MAG: DNA polymerase III subunit alpha, partial [Limibacillus sp.]